MQISVYLAFVKWTIVHEWWTIGRLCHKSGGRNFYIRLNHITLPCNNGSNLQKTMGKNKYYLLVCLFFLIINVKAENMTRNWVERYNITYLTIDDGLPHNLVDDLLKDSQGFLWVGTRGEGLVRYDGYEFISFNMGTASGKLRSNFIQKLMEDNFRRLWVVSDAGIDILDLETLDILNLGDSNHMFYQIQNQPISYIYHSKSGNVWICSMGQLFKVTFDVDGSVDRVIKICTLPEGETIRALCEVDDNLWINYKDGIYRIKENVMKELETSSISQVLRLPGVHITVIRKRSNEIWIGSYQGLFRYHLNSERLKHYVSSETNVNSLSQNLITDIAVTDDHNLLVSTFRGLNYYHSITDSFERINRDPSVEDSGIHDEKHLNCNFVNCLLSDRDIIWVGTETGGINKISRSTLYVQNYSHSNEFIGSLSRNPVNAIYEDKTGTLWVGTVEGGLNKKLPGSQSFVHYTTEAPAYLSHNSVSCFTADDNDRLWIGTWGGGFGWMDLKGKDKRFHHVVSADYRDASRGFVGTICYDSLNQVIWVGTGNHLYTYNLQTQKIENPFRYNDLGGIDGCTGHLIEDGIYLWIGMTKGLCRIDLRTLNEENPVYQLWEYKLDAPESKLAERVTDIIRTKDGTIWISSNGYGFYRSYRNEDGTYRFKAYTSNDGLASNSVRGMEEDKEGCIWITTTNGLSRFDPETESFYNYAQKDGLLSNQFYWNATGKSAGGDIYLGSINGLSVIKALMESGKVEEVPIVFTHLKIADQEIKSGDQTVRMHERDKTLSIEFAALDFKKSNLTAYSYRLKGFDDKWKRVSANRRQVTYTNLQAGNYIFEIQYAPDGTQWQEKITALAIHVEPYFYKTIWFNLSVFLLVGFAIYAFVWWRIHSFREQQRLLSVKVEERTRELKVQKQVLEERTNELYSQNELLKRQNDKILHQKEQLVEMSNKVQELTVDKLAFFTNITHEFRTPLTLIIGPIERALKLSYNPQVIEQLHFVERNSKYLLSLINQLMDFRKIESGKMEVTPNPNDFGKFLNDVLLPFHAYAEEHQITLKNYLRVPEQKVMYDESAMHKVLTNLLSNAVKFTPKGGQIKVYATALRHDTKELLYLNVCDDGPGIPNEDLEKVFDRFYQAKNQSNMSVSGQSGTGIGLYLCQQIIQLHGGEISVRNNPSGGCSFRVILPLVYASEDHMSVSVETPISDDSLEQPIVNEKNGRLTILVVEDNADMRSYIRSILEEYYQVIEATQGKEALDILTAQHVDFIISDLMMPVMDGMELSKRVKANFNISHIPFLMLTAKTSNESRIESFRIGVDEYLLKPFDDTLLLARIANILENRKRYQQKFSNSMDIDELNMEEASNDQKFLSKAMQIVKENYKDSYYEVTTFTEAMGVSKSLMNKKMKNLTGQSAGQFIRNYRLNVARELILKNKITRNKNISEIAYEVGFNDPKYFTRCFTRHFNQTPSSLMGMSEEESL